MWSRVRARCGDDVTGCVSVRAGACACAESSIRMWELGVGRLVLVLVLASGLGVRPRLGGERVGVVRARCGVKARWTATTSFG